MSARATRYPAFDALRAAAMELGLVLHAGVPYTLACPASWAFCDVSQSGAFDLMNTAIHAFRMPVFFLMSGFFAALLLERVGTREFVLHRLRRIALPLMLAGAVLVPLIRVVWIYGAFHRPDAPVVGDFPASLRQHFREEGLGVFETIWHLWFLEYLLILTAGFLMARWAFAAVPVDRLLERAADGLVSPWRALWLAVPTSVAMMSMVGWNVDGIGELVPVPHLLAYYAIFFAAGVLLYRRRDSLEGLQGGWRLHAVAAFACLAALVSLARIQTSGDAWVDGAARIASAGLTCASLFALVGLFVEYFSGENRRQRYLSDAAYFVYLAHFPLIAVLGLGFSHLAIPAAAKILGVLALAVPILLALYHFGVRYTPVGRLLHGVRSRDAAAA